MAPRKGERLSNGVQTTIVIKNRSRRDIQSEDPESEDAEDEVVVGGNISEDTAEVETEESTPFPSDDEALQQRVDQPPENEAVPEDKVILSSTQADQEAPSPKPLELKFEILSQLKLLVDGKPPKQQPDNTRVIVRITNATDLDVEINALQLKRRESDTYDPVIKRLVMYIEEELGASYNWSFRRTTVKAGKLTARREPCYEAILEDSRHFPYGNFDANAVLEAVSSLKPPFFLNVVYHFNLQKKATAATPLTPTSAQFLPSKRSLFRIPESRQSRQPRQGTSSLRHTPQLTAEADGLPGVAATVSQATPTPLTPSSRKQIMKHPSMPPTGMMGAMDANFECHRALTQSLMCSKGRECKNFKNQNPLYCWIEDGTYHHLITPHDAAKWTTDIAYKRATLQEPPRWLYEKLKHSRDTRSAKRAGFESAKEWIDSGCPTYQGSRPLKRRNESYGNNNTNIIHNHIGEDILATAVLRGTPIQQIRNLPKEWYESKGVGWDIYTPFKSTLKSNLKRAMESRSAFEDEEEAVDSQATVTGPPSTIAPSLTRRDNPPLPQIKTASSSLPYNHAGDPDVDLDEDG
ncbi:hypothetical protein DL765_003342 [Monosporascus sp. GIB2]|nr:hypothetical protein DL765_003342 [Monosporascus sp. GIB2]